jgi:hypothetical protein
MLETWEEAPVSMYQSLEDGGAIGLVPAEDRAARRAD